MASARSVRRLSILALFAIAPLRTVAQDDFRVALHPGRGLAIVCDGRTLAANGVALISIQRTPDTGVLRFPDEELEDASVRRVRSLAKLASDLGFEEVSVSLADSLPFSLARPVLRGIAQAHVRDIRLVGPGGSHRIRLYGSIENDGFTYPSDGSGRLSLLEMLPDRMVLTRFDRGGIQAVDSLPASDTAAFRASVERVFARPPKVDWLIVRPRLLNVRAKELASTFSVLKDCGGAGMKICLGNLLDAPAGERRAGASSPMDVYVAPKTIGEVAAVHPAWALEKGVGAEVTTLATIDAFGKVVAGSIRVSGGKDFDSAALAALRNTTFAPYAQGKPSCLVRFERRYSFPISRSQVPGKEGEAHRTGEIKDFGSGRFGLWSDGHWISF